MRSPLFRLTLCLGLLALAGCEKKKPAPTETGSILDTQAPPAAVSVAQALTSAIRLG
jgi:hypothetical protein